jgi:hypothetical protein
MEVLMNRYLALVAVILLFASIHASAEVPDPDLSTVEPWDTYNQAFVAPGDGSGFRTNVDDLVVLVLNSVGDAIEGATVVIDFDASGGGLRAGCSSVCVDPIDAGLTAETNELGIAVLNPLAGGCDNCTVTVRANGATIGTYDFVNSTDWNGSAADGAVTGADFAFFATAFKDTQDRCADYNGDGAVTGTDFSIFATSFFGGDMNPGGCGPPPSP